MGQGKESNPTTTSANMLGDTSVDTTPTHHLLSRHTTNALAEILNFSNCYFVTSFSWKQEQPHKKGLKHES